MRHRLVIGSFAALQPALFRCLDELKDGDPLRAVEVLVGGNLLAVHLRRRYAETRGAVANLRFLTFLDLARTRAGGDGQGTAAPRLSARRLARRALLETPAGAAFGRLRDRPSLARLLVRTADDLRDAGFLPEDLSYLLPDSATSPDRREALARTADVLVAFEALRSRFADETRLMLRAAEARQAPPREGAPLVVYGVYDLGGVRERLLRRVASDQPVWAFVPEDGRPEPVDGLPIRAELFTRVLGVLPDSLDEPAPAATRVVHAASENDEARETVREVLAAFEDGVPLSRVAVLLHDPVAQEPAIVAELTRAGVPFFRPAGGTFGRSPAGRAARLLLRLAADDYRREDVKELLDLAETLGIREDLGFPGPLTDLMALAERLGIVSGRTTWERRLARAVGRFGEPAPVETFAPGEGDAPLSRRERLARAARDLTLTLHALSRLVPEATPAGWAVWSERLRVSFERLLPRAPHEAADAPSRYLREAVAEIAALESIEPGARLEVADVIETLDEALELGAVPHGRFEVSGVALVSTVTARGLLFDVVIVPGLTEKVFPSPGRPDPLLFDEERKALRDATGAPLVSRSGTRHAREERFLFELARGAGRTRVVLLTCRRDTVRDRVRLPSPFLADVLEASRTEAPSERTTALGRVSSWGPALVADELLRRRRIASTNGDFPALTRSLRRALARREGVFGPYEGLLGRATPVFDLSRRVLSASRLERFAACPYRGLLRDGLGLPEPPRADDDLVPDTLTLGSLAHAALRDLARRLVARGLSFRGLTDVDAEIAMLARKAVDSWASVDERELPPIFRERAEQELRTVLAAFVTAERARPDPLPVAGAEVRFGPPGDDPEDDDPTLSRDAAPALVVSGQRLRFRGRIDRVDHEGGRVRVVDYKLGKPAPYGKENRRGLVIAGGERAQLPLYALAVQALFGGRVSSEYAFVERPRGRSELTMVPATFDEDATARAIEAFTAFLAGARDVTDRGAFLPITDSHKSRRPCATCELDVVCGAGHTRLYEKKWREDRSGSADSVRGMRSVP